MKVVELAGTSESDGSLTVTADKPVTGFIEKVVMVYDDGATGGDSVFTAEGVVSEAVMTKADLGTADAVFYPRTLANKVADGTAFTDVFDKIFVVESLFKVVISNGGDGKNFRFLVYVSDY